MDIKLGNIGVSSAQISNSHSLAVNPIKGFGHKDGEVVVVATRDLTAEEKTALISSLQALPEIDVSKADARRNRRQAVRAALNLDAEQFIAFIRGLREILADRNDN